MSATSITHKLAWHSGLTISAKPRRKRLFTTPWTTLGLLPEAGAFAVERDDDLPGHYELAFSSAPLRRRCRDCAGVSPPGGLSTPGGTSVSAGEHGLVLPGGQIGRIVGRCRADHVPARRHRRVAHASWRLRPAVTSQRRHASRMGLLRS